MPPTWMCKALCFGEIGGAAEQREIRRRREVVHAEDIAADRRVGRGRLGEHDVAQLHARVDRAAGADADQRLGVVGRDQFVDVDRQRRLAHAGRLHADRLALPRAGEAEAVAHAVHLAGVCKERLGHPFRARAGPPAGAPPRRSRLFGPRYAASLRAPVPRLDLPGGPSHDTFRKGTGRKWKSSPRSPPSPRRST